MGIRDMGTRENAICENVQNVNFMKITLSYGFRYILKVSAGLIWREWFPHTQYSSTSK